jgi:hypothetical protein
MTAKIEPGTYQCKTTAATIYEAPSGAVMCRIGLDIGLTGGICLVQKDGTLSERGIRDVAALFELPTPWDWSAWDVEPEHWAGHDIEAVVEIQQGDKGEFSSVKYLNVPGSNRMERTDAKKLSAKYGAKMRAMFGGTSKPAPAVKSAPPAAKSAPPKAQKPTATMEECWAKHLDLGNDEDPETWYAAIRAATGKEQNDCTPEDWGRFLGVMNDNVKM